MEDADELHEDGNLVTEYDDASETDEVFEDARENITEEHKTIPTGIIEMEDIETGKEDDESLTVSPQEEAAGSAEHEGANGIDHNDLIANDDDDQDEVMTQSDSQSFILPSCEVIINEGPPKKPEVITIDEDDNSQAGEILVPVKKEAPLPTAKPTLKGQIIAPTINSTPISRPSTSQNDKTLVAQKRPLDSSSIDVAPKKLKDDSQCTICGAYIKGRNMKKHQETKHKIFPKITDHLHDCDLCYIKNDNSRFDITDHYILHLNHAHKETVKQIDIHHQKFETMQEFENFKENLQIQCTTQFNYLETTDNTQIYRCNRFAYPKDLANPDKKKSRTKITSGCPVYIECTFYPSTGRVDAKFCLEHIGHDVSQTYVSRNTVNHVERERHIHDIADMINKFDEKYRNGSLGSLKNLKQGLAKVFKQFDDDNPLFRNGKYVPPKPSLAPSGTLPPPGLKTYSKVSKPGLSGAQSNSAGSSDPKVVAPAAQKVRDLKPVYPLRPAAKNKNILVAPALTIQPASSSAFTPTSGNLNKMINNIIASTNKKVVKKRKTANPPKLINPVISQKVVAIPRASAQPAEKPKEVRTNAGRASPYTSKSIRTVIKPIEKASKSSTSLPSFNAIRHDKPAKTYTRTPKSASNVNPEETSNESSKENPNNNPKDSRNMSPHDEPNEDGLHHYFDIPKIPSMIVPESAQEDVSKNGSKEPKLNQDAKSAEPPRKSPDETPERILNVNPKKRILQEYSEGSFSNPIDIDDNSDSTNDS